MTWRLPALLSGALLLAALGVGCAGTPTRASEPATGCLDAYETPPVDRGETPPPSTRSPGDTPTPPCRDDS